MSELAIDFPESVTRVLNNTNDIPKELLEAVELIDRERLNEILTDMIMYSPDCAREAFKRLLTAKELVHPRTFYAMDHTGTDSEGSGSDAPGSSDAGEEADLDNERGDERPVKRRRTDSDQKALVVRYQPCRICKQVFDIMENERGACTTHPGKISSEDEDWFGFEPNVPDGQYSSLDDHPAIRMCPDSFLWECCGSETLDEGCVRQRYKVHDGNAQARTSAAVFGPNIPYCVT